MASRVLRSIHRQAASFNWAGRKSTSGSPMRTVSDRISSAAAVRPWLMLPPSYDCGGSMFNRLFGVGGKMDYKFYSLGDDKVISVSKRSSIGTDKLKLRSERKAVLVGSSHGWLAFYKSWSNFDLFLYNPLSHRHIKLPPVAEEWRGWPRPFKIILSCSPDEEDSRAIMCFGGRSKIAMCCPGRSTEWTPFGDRCYEDFVYSKTRKQLFCFTQTRSLESWDLEDPLSPKLNWKKVQDDFKYDEKTYPLFYKTGVGAYPYLVFAEHSNQLFLVRRHVMRHMAPDGSRVEPIYGGLHKRFLEYTVPHMTIDFQAYVIDCEKGEILYMDGTLDGKALFIGSSEHGFAVESPETMNLKPNSIYFTDAGDPSPPPRWYEYYKTHGGHDIGICDFRNMTFSPCYYPRDINKVQRIHPPPVWFTPSHV